ncbi:MAG: galactose-1-phosphate uridylyltransferase [Fimbriimonadaceae bacterium]
MSELRHHPFLDQWVITATHRQDRTFLPPKDFCPLCPTTPGGFPTEVPFPSYDIVVFENKFPSLRTPAAPMDVDGTVVTPARPSEGVCEVVCYSSDHDVTFASLPLKQVQKLTRVWRDRYIHLSSREEVEYIFIFENKGKEIGVTLVHPHGQIYAYPFIPPVLTIEVESERRYYAETGRPLMADVIDQEVNSPRLIYQSEAFVAFVPFFARYPYEVYVAPKRHVPSLAEMSESELDDLARTLLVVTRKYDALFGFSMPYIMAMHQRPAKGGHDHSWFHVEFYPPYRTESKLKYLAGSEAGAGAFINDTLPEVTGPRLAAIDVADI